VGTSFSGGFSGQPAWQKGASPGMFGTDVLDGLLTGMDEYRRRIEQRPRRARSLGPAAVGAFKRLDDEELMERLTGFPAACVVLGKQPREPRKVDRLTEVVKRGPGFPAGALPSLTDEMLLQNGRKPVLGPANPTEDVRLATLRTTGLRGRGGDVVPALHTKMVLLGELWWHDETTLGRAEDVVEFTPHRLWVGSANATARSRGQWEFGLWADDRALLLRAQQFLVHVLARSDDWAGTGAPAPGTASGSGRSPGQDAPGPGS